MASVTAARAEVGNLHVGAAGHYGRGLGLFYALEPDDVSVSSSTFELRTFDGYSGVVQYVLGRFDINGGRRHLARVPARL